MRNANPRDGEIGRSWGKWFDRQSERRAAMVHAHERARAVSDAAIQGILSARQKPPAARLIVGKKPECLCGCKGDPFICIEADGS
ncbi:hypothetical protein [Novosphingobium sp. THN1]|uniref:hypothetical protein n=1 Tax=Novosphingobium sp. THN1 TaxID=1016987 RepID=UPI0013C2DDDD|nr:hypothetical protein [Novosphingobium sp. THN1]